MYGDSRENSLEILAVGARGKSRAAAARHSQHARAHTESPPGTIFFHIFWVEPRVPQVAKPSG